MVLPCLDEERTVGGCVEEARRGLPAHGFEAEVIVVDNGSTDRSVVVAKAAGARVVVERRRGYGSALWRGIRESQGDVIVLGDADGSYSFEDLAPLVAAVDQGADLVMGSRLRGTIEPGAMPFLNRYFGTPALTFLVNRLFGTRISDVNCGLRALRAEAARRLDLRAAGMEFASEMVLKAARAGLRIAEVSVPFRRDGRDRPPHLRRWRDGWRHLRFILLASPNVVLVGPGLALLSVGTVLGAPAFLGSPRLGAGAAFLAAALVLLGAQLMQVGVIVKTWYHVEGFYPRPYLERLFRHIGFEAGLLLGLGLLAIGVIVTAPILLRWKNGLHVEGASIAAALTFLGLGVQVIASSVILSVLGIRRRRG